MTQPLIHHNHGRNRRTVIGFGLYLAFLALLVSVGTVDWIVILLALFAVPAAFDLVQNPVTEFELSDEKMRWKNKGQEAVLPLSRIRQARFDTRWDFSVRVTLILIDNSKLRVPQDAAPPHAEFENALKDRGIKTERHHFRVI